MALDIVLLVIDAQESFRHHSYFRKDGVTNYINRQQALIDGAKGEFFGGFGTRSAVDAFDHRG